MRGSDNDKECMRKNRIQIKALKEQVSGGALMQHDNLKTIIPPVAHRMSRW